MKKIILLFLSCSFSLIGISQSVGVGTQTPDPSSILESKSTTQGFLPPRMTTVQRDLIAGPAEGLMIYNTTTKGLNFFDGTGWVTLGIPKIGDIYRGGIIAYILLPGDPGYDPNVLHGLIVSPTDLGPAEWGCYGTNLPGTANTAIGTGNTNTNYILIGCSTPGIAARICGDLVLNGFSDWYLPSKDELNQVYIHRIDIRNLLGTWYWSSSQDIDAAFPTQEALVQNFSTGIQAKDFKNTAYSVRAVRSF